MTNPKLDMRRVIIRAGVERLRHWRRLGLWIDVSAPCTLNQWLDSERFLKAQLQASWSEYRLAQKGGANV